MGDSISTQEFTLMQKYIRDYCGIQIEKDKAYLIESRLGRLLSECGAKNFIDFYHRLTGAGCPGTLADKVTDAITIKETQWFRDKTPWRILEDVLLPGYINELRKGSRSSVRIWSAACSTGQEPYSTAMCIDRYLKRHGIGDIRLSDFEILATDISPAVLEAARTGRYDNISVMRGLDDDYRSRYMRQEGRHWVVDEKITGAVNFKQLNLCNSFLLLGRFDVIFCRYVTIYFFEELKSQVLRKMASALNHRGVLFLGNSEIFADYRENFVSEEYKGSVYFRVARCGT